ncbi:hypothetical protein [Nocardioides aequoreus]|uniref:hypothetical protein n=1 Tax=Nocardioides aequoreus TaxID=397278 RepID=UPI0004C44567|nr:hypothetical protein [Nocardioides aequoreus]
MPALRKAPTKTQQAHAMLSDPHLYELFDVFARHRPGANRPVRPADLACFILDVESRIYGNRQQVEAANAAPTVWAKKRKLVREFSGRTLPSVPPGPDTVRKWRSRWLPPLDRTEDVSVPEVLTDLLDAATKLGAKRARKLGQFKAHQPRNFADPSPRHNVSMDGTWLSPFSHAKSWTDPQGVERLLRSKAKSKATIREQQVVHSTTKDGRKVMGVNHVVGVTRTKYGRVFLGVQRALRGENLAALELTERIVEHTEDGMHSLTYDKGFHGWTTDYLAAKHGIQTVIPAKVATAGRTEEEQLDHMLAEQALRVPQFDAQETLRRTGNDTTTRNARSQTTKKKAKARAKKSIRPNNTLIEAMAHDRQAERHDLAGLIAKTQKGIPTGHGLPLGTSHYVSSQNKLITVRSQHDFYRDIKHTHPRGSVCTHSVHVDDGAFWVVDWYDGAWHKTQRVTCSHSAPVADPVTGHHTIVSTHQLYCRQTRSFLDFDTIYEPRHKPGKPTPAESAARSKQQKALALMQPIARCDERFRRAYGLRNDIESWFSDMKNRLLADRRAASLDLNHQMLDVLYAGMVTNALALRIYRYEH